jgi:transcriptional regulator with PAS, ATPase and Fis domain
MGEPETISGRGESIADLGIVGVSVEMQKIADVVRQVAPTDITVLITGESGVGKEVIAKAIHIASARSKKPLITVNCGAIPEGIMESELFGHERGSFTGASDQRKGYFELADGGTIFLDEIGELSLAAQVKFLRILENGEYQRVGSSAQRRVNVRVVAATNKDLELEVRQKHFRADLFYRLRSVNIFIPPLRDRVEDVSVLFRYFVNEITERDGIKFGGISSDAMELLRSFNWPGNVRELRNAAESMLVLQKGRRIDVDDVRGILKKHQPVTDDRSLPVPFGKSVEQAERELILRALLDIKGNLMDLRTTLLEHLQGPGDGRSERRDSLAVQTPAEQSSLSLEEMERRMIVEALERYKGNRRVAARMLNISERTLYRKIKEYGLA